MAALRLNQVSVLLNQVSVLLNQVSVLLNQVSVLLNQVSVLLNQVLLNHVSGIKSALFKVNLILSRTSMSLFHSDTIVETYQNTGRLLHLLF